MFETLFDFEGLWRVSRVVRHDDGTTATFEGVAVFHPDGQGLSYDERGTLLVAQYAEIMAQRRYLWRSGPGRQINVLFANGDAFHRIDPYAPVAQHWCDPDQYDVQYSFDNWPKWSSVWHVRGPRKSYEMETHYERDAD